MGVLLPSLYDVEIKTERGRVIAWGHTKQEGELVIDFPAYSRPALSTVSVRLGTAESRLHLPNQPLSFWEGADLLGGSDSNCPHLCGEEAIAQLRGKLCAMRTGPDSNIDATAYMMWLTKCIQALFSSLVNWGLTS